MWQGECGNFLGSATTVLDGKVQSIHVLLGASVARRAWPPPRRAAARPPRSQSRNRLEVRVLTQPVPRLPKAALAGAAHQNP